jgi:hypothetical protein
MPKPGIQKTQYGTQERLIRNPGNQERAGQGAEFLLLT